MLLEDNIRRALKEDLKPFKVPAKIRAALLDRIMDMVHTPETKKYGATVMTPEASIAADRSRKQRGKTTDPKPRVL